MRTYEVPAGADLDSSLAAFGPALGLPAWFGANLDALVDALRDLPGPARLEWRGSDRLDKRDRKAIARALRQVADERSDLTVDIR